MKTLTFVLLSTLLLSSLAQDCNNPLLDTFNLTGLSTPQSGADLPLCQDLQGGQTCCSVATVAQFQALINNLQESLLNTSALRDQNLAAIRANITNFDASVDQLDDFDADITSLQQLNATIGNQIRSELTTLQDISNRLDNVNDNSEFVNVLGEYQRRRVTCFNTLLQVQASAWCLACNPNYASLGVSEDGSIAFSAALNNSIVAACLPFTEAGNNLNALFQANQTSDRVQSLIGYLQAFRAGGNVVPNLTISNETNIPEAPEERTNTVPTGCSGNVCVFQNDNLFSNGSLNETLAANGAGVIGGADISFPEIGGILPPPQNNGTNNTNGTNGTNGTNTTVGGNGTNTTNTTNGTTPVNETDSGVVVDNSTTVVDNSTNVVDNTTEPAETPARLLQSTGTWSPNLGQTGVQLNVTADPGQVTGLQGDGSNSGNTPAPNPTPTPTPNPEGDSPLYSGKVVASALTISALIMGTLMV